MTKMKTNILNNTRIELLDKLGFDWSAKNAKWEMRFQQAQAYAREHGHCNISTKLLNNSQLGIWICTQRQLHRQRIKEGWEVNATR
jgi:hypothetical protein